MVNGSVDSDCLHGALFNISTETSIIVDLRTYVANNRCVCIHDLVVYDKTKIELIFMAEKMAIY